jgi:hypothetical protein
LRSARRERERKRWKKKRKKKECRHTDREWNLFAIFSFMTRHPSSSSSASPPEMMKN